MAAVVLLDLPQRNRICPNAGLWMENGTYGGEQRLSLSHEGSAALEGFRPSPSVSKQRLGWYNVAEGNLLMILLLLSGR